MTSKSTRPLTPDSAAAILGRRRWLGVSKAARRRHAQAAAAARWGTRPAPAPAPAK